MNTRIFKKWSLLSVGLLMILGSCRKYLDQQPTTELSADVVFSDVPSALKALSGVYSRLVGDQVYGIRISLYFPVDND